MPIKDFENRSITGEDIDKSKVARFYGPHRVVPTDDVAQLKVDLLVYTVQVPGEAHHALHLSHDQT